jgi:hypothetical protein
MKPTKHTNKYYCFYMNVVLNTLLKELKYYINMNALYPSFTVM